MGLKNTSTEWGWLSKLFHWLTAALIFIQIPLGFYADSLKLSAWKIDVFVWHKSFGMLVFLLLVVRLLWRIKSTVPVSLATSKLQKILASTVHALLYALMFALPISGWIITSAANLPVKLFWLIHLPAITDPNSELKALAAEIHELCVFALIALLALHIAAAIRHQFVLADSAIKRLWF